MRTIFIFMLALPMAIFAAPFEAEAMSDAVAKKMLTKFVHSYCESDPDTFWKIVSKFENPQFNDHKDISLWMEERLSLQMTYLKVEGVLVAGMARIASEKLGEIEFRFDGLENSEHRVIVVTAWVNRVIEFDDTVPSHHRKVDQEAILKIYVTLINERLASYKSDEINFGYSFANNN